MRSFAFRPSLHPIAGRMPTQLFKPARRKPMIGQVQISPEVNVPINIGLGSLPVVIGAFAASGAAFLVGWQVPSIRGITNVVGIGLAAFGVVNVLWPGAPSGAQPESASVSPAPAGGQEASISPPIQATEEEAFQALEGRVVSPTEWQTIDVSPWASTVPVRIRLSNPVQKPLTFDLMITVAETPIPFSGEQANASSQRITIGPGETRDVDITIPLVTWGWSVNQVDVDLRIDKRRISGGDPALLAMRSFKVD